MYLQEDTTKSVVGGVEDSCSHDHNVLSGSKQRKATVALRYVNLGYVWI